MNPNTTASNATLSCTASKLIPIKVQVALFSCIIVTSLVGNSLVIFVVKFNRRMHSVANYLICNMSVSDLIITLLPMIWEVVSLQYYTDGTWPMGPFMCSLTYMCVYISVASSILSLTVISFDRFFAVLFPLKQQITRHLLPILLISIWIVSFAFASPTLFAQRLMIDQNKTYCAEIWKPPFDPTESPKHYTIILFVGLYAIPLTVMAVLYSTIAIKLWRRSIPGNRSRRADRQAMKQKKKVLKMLVCVIMVFAVCWFPVFCSQFLIFFNPYYLRCPFSFPQWLQFLAFFMQYLSSAVNPLVYFAFSYSFRVGLQHAVGWRVFRIRHLRQPTTTGSVALSTYRRRTVAPNTAEEPESKLRTFSKV